MDLLYEPESQKQAFVDACAWAEDIYLCLAWIEPGDAFGPSYAALKPHEHKVRQAIVGLARFQSYPALLRRLYRLSVLRLVSTVDGSFSPNCYLFRSGLRVRVLLSSAPFTSTRFSSPCESLVVFEGNRDDPLVLQAFELLDRCRASAHVPSSKELDAYDGAWACVRTGGREPEVIPGLRLQSYDTSDLGTLALECSASDVLSALVEVRDSLSAAASMRVAASFLPCWEPPDDEPVSSTLYWSSLGLWGAIHRSAVRFGLHFGLIPPWEVTRPLATISLAAHRTPTSLAELIVEQKSEVMAIARVEDGRRLLVQLLTAPEQNSVGITDGTSAARSLVIGQVGAADFVQTAAAFVQNLSCRETSRVLSPCS